MSAGQCRYCLACLAFYYPLFLLATFVVDGLPALLRAAGGGPGIERVDVSPRGVLLGGPGRPGPRTPAVSIGIACGLLLLLAATPERWRPFIGFFLAIVGTLGMSWIFTRRQPPWWEAVFLIVLFAGLWFHVRAIEGAWWMRLLAVSIVFAAPSVAQRLLTARGGPRDFLALAALPAVVAAVIAVFLTWKRQRSFTLGSWRPAYLGAALSVLAAVGLSAHDRMRAEADREAREARRAQAEAVSTVDRGRHFFQRGVNFTSEGWAHYGTEGSVRTLQLVKAKGVDSIALVPYGSTGAHEPRIRYGNPRMESDDGIAILTAEAHKLGMKVMLKPQMWVQPGGFPGAVEMPDAASVREWFAQYAGFADYYAKLAERSHIDIYCIGTEFVHMSRHTAEWRAIAAGVRKIYQGPIVYAATQGPEFENLAFWDSLDYIGLNNYYPLPDDFSTQELLKKVEAVQSKYRKPVLLTEAGYVSMEWPNRAPWDESPRALSMAHQARGYEAILKAFWDKPWFAGIYWWRVGSNGEGGPEDGHHTPWGKSAMDVVTRYYSQPPAFEGQ